MTPENSTLDITHCSFCGKHKDSVAKLIVGNNVGICNECVDLCQSLLTESPEQTKSKSQDPLTGLDPRAIKRMLDDYVIGQEQAKIVLAVAVVNHYKRLFHPSESVEVDKANIMMLGPTGSGKTLLAKTVARYLDVPFAIGDATSITEAGYVGDDVESLIVRLINNADGDIERAQRGIVFLDEVDKISRKSESTSITRDVSGEGVQQALLKLVEGTICRVPTSGANRKHPSSDIVEFDTRNVLFICSGAFVGLNEVIEKRLQGSGIGFTSNVNAKSDQNNLARVTPDDLVRYGLIPEFVGRFPTRVALDQLTKEDMIKILVDVKNNYIVQYRHLFDIDGVDLEFDPFALEAIVDRALSTKTGARGLQSEIERVLMPHMYRLPQYKQQRQESLVITEDMVNNPIKLGE